MGTAPVTKYWILAIVVPLADEELTLDASVSVGRAQNGRRVLFSFVRQKQSNEKLPLFLF